MKTMINRIIRIFVVLLASFFVLNACTDEDFISPESGGEKLVTLTLPLENMVNIGTRAAISPNQITNILACITNGNNPIKKEILQNFTTDDNKVSLKLKWLNPKSGDKLHIFCNVDMDEITDSKLNLDSEEALLETIKASDALDGRIVMYGSTTDFMSDIKVNLKRSLAKVVLTCSEACIDAGYTIQSWKICNAPTDSYILETIDGYPSGTEFIKTELPSSGVSSPAYMYPRKDNGVQSPNTYLIIQLNTGWYKLEFQKDNNLISIKPNNAYLFNITSITNEGYQTEEEAIANPGSNIVYDIEVDLNNATSNGQYILLTDKESIGISGLAVSSLSVLTVSTKFLSGLNFNISTYSVTLVNPGGGITLLDAEEGKMSYSILKKEGFESDHVVKIDVGQNVKTEGSFLEIRLGNIKKIIPIVLNTANCYLFDFQSNVGNTLAIPVEHANKIEERITESDVVTPKIIWSDVPLLDETDVKLNYIDGLIKITNLKTFTGNFVVAAVVGDVIKWSWHIWALDATVLEFNNVLGIYDFRNDHVQSYCNYDWMDRNLGAYDLRDLTKAAARGLLYQWGRKDPFPNGEAGGGDFLMEPALYYEGSRYTFTEGHPAYGSSIEEMPVNSAGGNNLDYSIKNPMKILHRSDPYSGMDLTTPNYQLIFDIDWFTSNFADRNDHLWQTVDGKKEVYDPCPIGWKVPDGGITGPWAGIKGVVEGPYSITWTNSLLTVEYPYCCYRDGEELRSLNQEGTSSIFWWANQSGDTNMQSTAWTLNKGDLAYTISNLRAYSMAIRCVREDK